ncbi:YbfB/YjiJ family MFS transporter [Alloalcanivorax xenomutans]|uniref:YbfB/YjiJ family MFS transporter n=3 Tax=Alloalcanivorax xenomutans TaxID=1094342 RepID=UPI0004AD6DBC|nr:YbfB/YjiJ family MFS transporter [Alloalcanivorax xenomutans]PHS70470.1 MAG: MFS transporter [Alcanivorax sp.]CUR45200.1 major facilitator superfamily (MFS) transporter [Alloalcanivorax xenomutans]
MPISTMKKTTDERGDLWRDIFTALGLSTGAAVALGLSRFAYGLLLPPMQADLQWTYVEAGALNTANGAGYIFGALVAAWLARRWGTARAFLAGFSVSVLVLLLTAMTASLSALILLRTVGGVSTAITFILGAGLVSAICPLENPRRRGALVGVYVAGVSIGVILAGAALPIILQGGVQRWPEGWIVLGLLGAAGLPAAWLAARRVHQPAGGTMALLSTRECRRIAPTLIGYGVFGAGYVGYMTFIMALLREQGGSSEQMIWFWFTLGLVSAVTNLLWGRVLGAFSDGRGPALVFATAMLGTLPVLLYPGPVAMLLSAILFGGSFMAGPTSITIVAQRQLSPASWTAAISLLTVGFAFGQTIGPILAGAISDVTGSIEAGFWVSPLLLAIAACVNLLQRPPVPAESPALAGKSS